VAASPGNLKHSHHKLGVIIFALVFFQFFLGVGIAVIHRLQSKKPRERRTFIEYAPQHHAGMINGLKHL
jgi:heme/copper-type cytochrome/quinol oxidase subunit 1